MPRVSLSWLITVCILTTSGCFGALDGRDVDEDCVDACEAENACPDTENTNCGGLCGAVPDDCAGEIAGYWDCAAAHLDEACDSFLSCTSEFSELTVCVGVYCLIHPLDSACYYWD